MARLDDVRDLLEDEKADLEKRLEQVNAALQTLNGGGGAPAATRSRSTTARRPARGRKTSSSKRAASTKTKAELTCPECGFVAKAPQGLAGHMRNKHPEAAAAAAQTEETAATS